MIHITEHAVSRYQERVAPALNSDEAHAAILSHSKAIDAAVLGRHQYVRKVGL